MLGYVYVMSNEAMPGLYKIGCTSRHPLERASDLYTTGVPTPFVVEYCINIDNYANIERLVHKELSAYNFGKEFFKCDLDKCILTIKKVAGYNSKYSESYSNNKLKDNIEKNDNKNSTYNTSTYKSYYDKVNDNKKSAYNTSAYKSHYDKSNDNHKNNYMYTYTNTTTPYYKNRSTINNTTSNTDKEPSVPTIVILGVTWAVVMISIFLAQKIHNPAPVIIIPIVYFFWAIFAFSKK